MRISIDSENVIVKSGVGKNEKPYEICTQVAYLDIGKRYPVEFKFRVFDKTKPYPPGEYVIDMEKSVYVDKYNRIAMSEELVLVPLGSPESGSSPKSVKAA